MAKKTNTKQTPEINNSAVISSTMTQDLKNAVLIVSVVLNLVVFTMWVALQITSRYDLQLASFLLNR
jgi:hypothetical protein